MKITDITFNTGNGIASIEATITWEQGSRPPFRFFIQTLEAHRDRILPDPNAFLLATLLSAWHYGETRISVEGTLCPLLANNLEGVFMMLKAWYPEQLGKPPVLEPTQGFSPKLPGGIGTVSLMSGGIDSLCLLRSNHQFYPVGHPDRIQSVVTIEMRKQPVAGVEEFTDIFAGRLTSVNAAAEDEDVTVMPACTNVYYINPDGYFYGQKSYSSQLSAVLSFFSKSFHHGLIASSYDAAFASKPWGSNPQLDAYYTSAHFRMENSGSEMTRLRKVGIVAEWPVGFKSIRVCQNDNSGSSNCGTCEKCIRTKLMLEALGKLETCPSFRENKLDVALLEYLETYKMLSSTDILHNQEKVYQYGLTIPYLKARGRNDLAEYLQSVLDKLV